MLKDRDFSKWQLWSLVILRVAIGWHFLYEGLVKLNSANWTAAPYLIESSGVFAPAFRWMAKMWFATLQESSVRRRYRQPQLVKARVFRHVNAQ